MAKSLNFSSAIELEPTNQAYDSQDIPARWIDCPRKSAIIAEKFIAFKTPLDDRYKNSIEKGKHWTCQMLIKNIKDDHRNLGLVIDLTNTDRYYRSNIEFTQENIRYEKIRCQGHNGTPSKQQVNRFILICREFQQTNPNDLIGVHCTHGFNRTGFLICAYLCQRLNYRIDTAIDLFAKARAPGIYKQDYLNELIRDFKTDNIATISAPLSPPWGQINLSIESSINKRPNDENHREPSRKRFRNVDHMQFQPKFAIDHPHIVPIYDESTLHHIRTKCQQICQWNRQSFPGSQPISMDKKNYKLIFESPYMVSWKADGTRYMMLIEDKDRIYMLDRNNHVFQIHRLLFPTTIDSNEYLKDTLLDGEFVIDKHNGTKIYRYLVYDIIMYNNVNVSQKSHGHINKAEEPFSIRNKPFWDLKDVSHLLSEQFQSQITHGCDGLVFQPVNDPYQCGRAECVLKWKEDDTIDFQLKITNDRYSQKKEAELYLNKRIKPFAKMIYSPKLEQYNGQIIECSYRNGGWHFYRHRIDKTYPNAQTTAEGVMNAIQYAMTKNLLCTLIEEHVAFNNYLS
ncbi:hypothetical protein I4U23_007687 [Adineta vaga]|nr:hypothetical protein I4U23_007687 [Adineta vaga]